METKPMHCDIETGICEIPVTRENSEDTNIAATRKPIKLLYFTDPICSSCWGIDPQLKKMALEYGAYFEVEYRMGGLLQSWETYGGRDVNGPKSVARHWEEAGAHYEMPIDGDLWLEDPLPSSYPPSIAFKAAQLQGQEKAGKFLRRIKEMVFLEKKNIARWENLALAAEQAGLNVVQFKADSEGKAVALFQKDLALARQLGVRGFPTIFVTDAEDNRILVYGSRPYEYYEQALLQLHPKAKKQEYDKVYTSLFGKYSTLTTREYAVVAGMKTTEAEAHLQELHAAGKIGKYASKNGALWMKL
ncbi:ClpXP adapter SpxH family protein [Pontibacter lucknowensis]|uniref:Predicted dithiol-disulfide isomerase, DsbA family n=1 Tax=Pontibacter lucknowensis TaxID=1077936 RepID=A0A1N6T8X7_9BACT|nr:ClpXP adapter SpxH family protein [Pontibacter lucknowensis]SIQ49763.1 Predicted dithiol-disulfide isomerase, DsbA family [Pontibacter lucknowensis]